MPVEIRHKQRRVEDKLQNAHTNDRNTFVQLSLSFDTHTHTHTHTHTSPVSKLTNQVSERWTSCSLVRNELDTPMKNGVGTINSCREGEEAIEGGRHSCMERKPREGKVESELD